MNKKFWKGLEKGNALRSWKECLILMVFKLIKLTKVYHSKEIIKSQSYKHSMKGNWTEAKSCDGYSLCFIQERDLSEIIKYAEWCYIKS